MNKPFPHLLVLGVVLFSRELVTGIVLIALGFALLVFRSRAMAWGFKYNEKFGLIPYGQMNKRSLKVMALGVGSVLIIFGFLMCLHKG